MSPLLETKAVSKHFGGLKAVDNVDVHLDEGEILGLIGPNGAGKTTLLNLISGALSVSTGTIWFKGLRIDHLPAHVRARMGIARTFQIVRPFAKLSVKDNILVGLGCKQYSSIFASFRRCRNAFVNKQVEEIIDLVGLSQVKDMPAHTLPLGILRRVEIARALALSPVVLLLDEPVAGLTEEERVGVAQLLQKIRDQSVSVLLVEHTMSFVMRSCGRIVVMHHGKKIAEGTPQEVAANPRVIEVYLGARKGANVT